MPVTARLSHSLHRALGDESGADIVDWMQQVDANRLELRELNELSYSRMESRIDRLEFKFDAFRHEIRADIAEFRQAIDAQIAGFRQDVDAQVAGLRQEHYAAHSELRADMAALELRLTTKIDRRFADLIKWSFVFWVGAVAAAALARG